MPGETANAVFLVVPAFNEGGRLAAFLPELCSAVRTSGEPVSLLVVDDGSAPAESSAMRAVVERLRAQHPFLLPAMVLEKNRGKGGAVYAGWDSAGDAEWLGFVDADGAVTAADAIRFASAARAAENLDGLFANRIHALGRPVERTFLRHLAGRIYATLSSLLTGIPVYDSQCGLKFVRGACYRRVRAGLGTMRFGFDMELTALLARSGCRLREDPLRCWRDVPGGKVRLLRDSVSMFFSLLALRKKLNAQAKKNP